MESNKSTQISDIIGEQNDVQEPSQTELVQEIINEIKMQEQQSRLENDIDTSVMEEKVHEMPRSEQQNNISYQLLDNVEKSNGNIGTEKKSVSMFSKIKNILNFSLLKEVLVVISLVLLLSIPVLNKKIADLIPKLSNEIGQLNFIGILVKSLVAGLVFFIVKLVL